MFGSLYLWMIYDSCVSIKDNVSPYVAACETSPVAFLLTAKGGHVSRQVDTEIS